MPAFRDLTGQRFGRLVVVQLHPEKRGQYLQWICRCDCGKQVFVVGGDMTRTRKPVRSCGCLRLDSIATKLSKDMTGHVFGNLTVLERVASKRSATGVSKGARWRCRCSCGKVIEVAGVTLRIRRQVSCGCIRSERNFACRGVDRTGHRYGRLFVLRRLPKGERRRKQGTAWECRCDCGKVCEVAAVDLRLGTRSCGCLQRDRAREHLNDITGRRFGRLTVLRRLPNAGSVRPNGTRKDLRWLCKCDCGKEKPVFAVSLRNGSTVSCGCYLKENNSRLGAERLSKGVHYKKDQYTARDGATYAFRSGWERTFAEFLDENSLRWAYEDRIIQVSRTMRYVPDFYLHDFGVVVEVKGRQMFKINTMEKLEKASRLFRIGLVGQREIMSIRRKNGVFRKRFLKWLASPAEGSCLHGILSSKRS